MRTFLFALLLGAAAQAGPAENKALLDIAVDLEAGKDVTAKIAAMRKAFSIDEVMEAYKSRQMGGIGTGLARRGDGIEYRILSLGKRAPSKEGLKKEAAELLKVAAINLALVKITAAYVPAKINAAGKGPKEWDKHLKDMEKATKDMIDAVKKGDPAAVKIAVAAINTSCNKCHDDFR